MTSRVLLGARLSVRALLEVGPVMDFSPLSAHGVDVVLAILWILFSSTNEQRFELDAHCAHRTAVGARSRVQETPSRVHQLQRCMFIGRCGQAQIIIPLPCYPMTI